jgi:hypothetical protein
MTHKATAAFWATVLLAIDQFGCVDARDHREQAVTLEEMALNEFISRYWGPDLFADECTGLTFDAKAPLLVFSQSPGFAVTLLDVAGLAPINLKEAATKEGGLESLARSGTSESFSNAVDLSAYPFAKPSDSAEPKDDWQPSDGYLLRFSNRVHFQERVYLQVWVKASRTSSGTRIDYEFDETGHLLRSRKQSRRCDDWG